MTSTFYTHRVRAGRQEPDGSISSYKVKVFNNEQQAALYFADMSRRFQYAHIEDINTGEVIARASS